MMYTLDSRHPDRLRCERCGSGFPVTLPADADPSEVACLTEDETIELFPALALELCLHGYLCPRAWFSDQETAERMARRGGIFLTTEISHVTFSAIAGPGPARAFPRGPNGGAAGGPPPAARVGG
jgi:hypothetical protein